MRIGKEKVEIRSRNIPILFVSEVIYGLLFFLPILALYYEESLFTVTNVAIVFAVEAFCVVLFEVPTGAIADLFGRVRSINLAYISALLALVFLAVGGSMLMFILYAVINAFARSLTSGTISALIYDSLKEEKKEQYFKKVMGNMLALWPLGASVGSILGGYMAAVSLRTPVLFSFVPVAIALVMTFFMKEPNYEREPDKNILKHMLVSSKVIFRSRQLFIIAAACLIMSSLGETIHRLDGIYFEFKQIPIVYFGFISAFIYGMSAAGHYLSYGISKKLGNKAALVIAYILSPLLTLLATFATGFGAAALFIIPSLSYGIKNPIIDHLINAEIPSSLRATVLSVNNFIGQLGFALAAPAVGFFSQVYDINIAIRISAMILFVVPVLFLLLKRERRETGQSSTVDISR